MENMETAELKPPPSPGTPLHPISPDRFNQQSTNRGSLASAELSPLHNKGRNVPDIQSRVAYFSNLSRTSSPSAVPQSATTTAALQRAILGREEAEAALHATHAQLTESNARERRVSERLESLMEELHSLKERQAHERTIFEKEVRKARKEAFRAGSTLVKVQEELKYARGQVKTLKEDLKAEREAKDKANQEAFERAYALAGLTEEMDAMKDKLRSVEADNKQDAFEAKTEDPRSETTPKKPIRSPQTRSSTPAPRSLKRDKPDSVGQRSPTRKRVFSGQNILSPRIESPVKLQPSPTRRSCIPAMGSEPAYNERAMIEALKSELRWEKRLRDRAEDMVIFLKMECQFKRCSCRLAENDGSHYVHDLEWAEEHPTRRTRKPTSPISIDQQQNRVSRPIDQVTQLEESQSQEQSELDDSRETDAHNTTCMTEEQASTIMTFNPDTGTFLSVPSPRKLEEMRRAGQTETMPPPQSRKRASSLIPSPPEKRRSGDRNHFTDRESSQSIQIPPERRSNSPFVLPNPVPLEPEDYRPPAEPSFAKESTPANQIVHSNIQTIPLAEDKPRNASFGPVPGTPINREEALAQIRARRDRAQSALKRSASANDANPPTSRMAAAPVNGGRRIPRVENAELRGPRGPRRDISAPVGKYY